MNLLSHFTSFLKNNRLLLLISTIYIAWAASFIYKTSFIAIDGKRYFSLFDDSMISMRYAWNFSHGYGLVWNVGERIEGFTNLLLTLYMSIWTYLLSKSASALAIQITGVITILLIAFVVKRIAFNIFEDYSPRLRNTLPVISFCLALSYYPLSYWSLMGMETGVISLLLLSAALIVLTKKINTFGSILLSTLLGAAFITRPDTLIPSSIIFTYFAFKMRTNKFQVIKAGIIFSLFVISTEAFRYMYYGSLTPNTYALKLTGMPVLLRLSNGLSFVKYFFYSSWPVICLATLTALFSKNMKILLLLSLIYSSIIYQIWVGGDPWAYWRMMSPFMPLSFILMLYGFIQVTLRIKKEYMKLMTVALLTIGFMFYVNFAFLDELFLKKAAYTVKDNKRNVNISIALSQITTEKASIAVFFAGTLPYYYGHHAIDILGKSDSYIAHLKPDLSGKVGWIGMKSVPGHNKYDLNYSIVKLKPTYTERLAWFNQDVSKKTNYKLFKYKGIDLLLDANSNEVNWKKLAAKK